MNLAFIAPEFLPNRGGAEQHIYHILNIQFPAQIERRSSKRYVKKPQMKRICIGMHELPEFRTGDHKYS